MFKELVHRKSENFQTSSTIEQFRKKAENFDVVTFDIFDTLIKRDVPYPTDIFTLLEEKLDIKGFKSLRIQAERNARRTSQNKEVTLNEIYDKLSSIVNYQEIKEAEKQIEIEECVTNLDILPFYKECLQNKKVLLITDMYLDRDTIEAILNKSELGGYYSLIISNEVNCVKSDGSLFEFVLNHYNLKRPNVIHFGNSMKADFLGAKKAGLQAVKITTYKNRKQAEYHLQAEDDDKELQRFDFLQAVINNHTTSSQGSYYQFGFEVFGPLLFGFVKWLYSNLLRENNSEVLFMARDGFVMKEAYDLLGYNKAIPSKYFEVSRRSLRVPTYNAALSFEDMLSTLTVPNLTDLAQIFDSWGLDSDEYFDVISKYGFNKDDKFRRDSLKNNINVKKMFDEIKGDIFNNSSKELVNLKGYLDNFDFSGKTAIVDIGWGGSMQRYLSETLENMQIVSRLIGYYIGLTQKSKKNLNNHGLTAKGYAFDCLNGESAVDLERPFVGLFETLFLEQSGSVKNYYCRDGAYYANRYSYEYKNQNGELAKEAKAVKEIQQGALAFIRIFSKSATADFVGIDNKVMFSNLYEIGTNPSLIHVNLFGDFDFFNNGTKVKLASPKSGFYYICHPQKFTVDMFNSQWKIGFLKGLLKVHMNYLKIFNLLRKITN